MVNSAWIVLAFYCFLRLQVFAFHSYSTTSSVHQRDTVRKKGIAKTMKFSSPIGGVNPPAISLCQYDGMGCVLLSQCDNIDNPLTKTAILVCESSFAGTKGVILDHPSMFTMGEVSPQIGIFRSNQLYLGGLQSGEQDGKHSEEFNNGCNFAIMVHNHPELLSTSDLTAKAMGNGIIVGGLCAARNAVESFNASPRDFKFLSGCVSWAPLELEKEIQDRKWIVCKIPAELIVQQGSGRDYSLWATLYNALRERNF